jgi:hypothetical protein
MPTATSATTKTRAEQIDEYVIRETRGVALYNVLMAAGDLVTDEAGGFVEDLAAELSNPLAMELWPTNVIISMEGDPEWEAATTRAIASTAAVLMQLTTTHAQDYLRAEGARLAALAAERMGDAARAARAEPIGASDAS